MMDSVLTIHDFESIVMTGAGMVLRPADAQERTTMATNTGKGYRRGPVKDRSQVHNPTNDKWTKRGPDGRFMDQKADKQPFKGVTKED